MTKLLLGLKDEAILAGFKTTRGAQYFQTLFARHKHRLYHTAFKILGCPDDAEEIVQEAFMRALQNVGEFKTSASLAAWLYAITHNLCIDALRTKRKNGENTQTVFDPQSIIRNHEKLRRSRYVVNQMADRLPDPAQQAELAELMQILASSLTYISNKQRVVVILHDIEGLPYETIAKLLCTNIGTVRSRLHYGRNRLKKILRPYVIDGSIVITKRRKQCSASL